MTISVGEIAALDHEILDDTMELRPTLRADTVGYWHTAVAAVNYLLLGF